MITCNDETMDIFKNFLCLKRLTYAVIFQKDIRTKLYGSSLHTSCKAFDNVLLNLTP